VVSISEEIEHTRLLDTLVRQAPFNLQVVDRNGSTVAASESCLRMFNIERADLVGPGVHNVLQDRRLREAGVTSALESAFSGERTAIPLLELPTEDGCDPLLISIDAFPIRQGDTVTHVGILYRDVREKVILQKNLLAKNAELEQFVYTVSHDLKSPLAVVTGCLELISETHADDAGLQKHIAMIERSAGMIRRFVDSLLALSRAGRTLDQKRDEPPVELGMLVKGIILDQQVSNAELSFTFRIDDLPKVSLPYTDCNHLFQNLIGNAIKYRHPDRRLHIEILCERTPVAWRFVVRDNGRGIPGADRERIFEVFTRGSQAGAGADFPEGTGVGLAIVRKIVEKAGGKVWVESRLGEGSSFCFTLPRTE
jgi:signal transduction histidine kinase